MYSTHRLFQRKRLFMGYILFATLICQELQTGLNGTDSYVVLDIVNSVCRLLHHHINDNVSQLLPLCCMMLSTVSTATIEYCPEVFYQLNCIIIMSL